MKCSKFVLWIALFSCLCLAGCSDGSSGGSNSDGNIGVSSSAPVAAAAEEEQTKFTVILESIDPAKKMDVIKAVKAATGLGLKEAMAIVTGAPQVVKEGISKADADKLIADITAAGGKVSKK